MNIVPNLCAKCHCFCPYNVSEVQNYNDFQSMAKQHWDTFQVNDNSLKHTAGK